MSADTAPLLQTPLHALHVELGAKMVPFAGYAMPVQYPAGILAEHRHCRYEAALFDVSHMGQLQLRGDDAAAALESLVPQDIIDLPVGKQRYAFFTNAQGGLRDDLMVTRRADHLFLVVNAGCKVDDTQHLITNIGHRCRIVPMPDHALLALQGPKAVAALERLNPAVATLSFMTGGDFELAGAACFVTRSGYTGEDGLEIGKLYDYDIIILDLMLPDMDGYEVLKRLRAGKVNTPILILSGLSELDNKIKGLGIGADDYLTKPFGVGELLARVRAQLRRQQPISQQANFCFGSVEVDFAQRVVRKSGQDIHLTKREYHLLCVLIEHAGRVMTHAQLLHAVWGPNHQEHEHYVRIYIANLRQKLENNPVAPQYLLTEIGVGYRLITSL